MDGCTLERMAEASSRELNGAAPTAAHAATTKNTVEDPRSAVAAADSAGVGAGASAGTGADPADSASAGVGTGHAGAAAAADSAGAGACVDATCADATCAAQGPSVHAAPIRTNMDSALCTAPMPPPADRAAAASPVQANDSGTRSPRLAASGEPDDAPSCFVYGHFVVLGRHKASASPNARLILKKASNANGLKVIGTALVPSHVARAATMGVGTREYSVSIHSTDTEVLIHRFGPDPLTDRFQFGRHPDVGEFYLAEKTSYMSRYAARVVCEREPPHRCMLFAAAFNEKCDIFLGPRAHRHCKGEAWDGTTTNGVYVFYPTHDCWVEITVMGAAVKPGTFEPVDWASNVLQDGAIVDFGRVLLQWHVGPPAPPPADCQTTVARAALRSRLEALNELSVHCPVTLDRVEFGSTTYDPAAHSTSVLVAAAGAGADDELKRWACAYIACGHVFGYSKQLPNICPMCRTESRVVPLRVALETSIDAGQPSHALSCGHVISEEGALFWSRLALKSMRGKHICPYCGEILKPVTHDGAFAVRLFFP